MDDDYVQDVLRLRRGLVLVVGPADISLDQTLLLLAGKIPASESSTVTMVPKAEPKQGLTIAGQMRKLDPAAHRSVVVGQIADRESAELVFEFAEKTLVIAGMFARDGHNAAALLGAMGITSAQFAGNVRLVVAQSHSADGVRYEIFRKDQISIRN